VTHTVPTPPADGATTIIAPPGYELREVIGRGGMGVVFRARDLSLDREVAVKLLLDGYAANSAAARRFVEEAQITGQLQHPGIPAVHQAGTTPDGRPFLAMKLVKGRTLDVLLKERPELTANRGRFLAVFEHVCHAVGYAHAHDVIHRDLKPSNVMVGAFDEVQVMDWGLAKVVTKGAAPLAQSATDADADLTRTAITPRREEDHSTQAGSLLGTPAFMSPEQAGGELPKIGPPADVFGLGAILCVILTGHPPYRGADGETLRLQAIRGELADAFARLDACGAEPKLVALVRRCLGPLHERPGNAAEVAAAVARFRAESEERARRAELERAAAAVRGAEQRKRRKVWIGLAAALLLGAAASVIFGVRAHQAEGNALRERDEKETARSEAVANLDRATTAEAARRQELRKTAAAAAELAAGRGRWDDAVRHYDTALELGGGDEVELRLGRFDCLMAVGQILPAIKELDELAARSDLERHAGPVLLRKAEAAMWRKGGGDPRELAQQAIARGLPPADREYAEVFRAETAPEAIMHLQEVSRLDPFNSRGLDSLMMLLFLTGRKKEFREVVAQMRLSRPGSIDQLMGELLLRGLEGDRAGVEEWLKRLHRDGADEFLPMFRSLAEVIVEAQDEQFFFSPRQPQKMASLVGEYSKMAQRLSQAMGDEDAANAKITDWHMFQLPMLRAMAELPQIKAASSAGPFGALALLNQPEKMAELVGALARALPDGTFLMSHALFLERAGRLADAEAAFRRAAEAPSWANHRLAARLNLARVQWYLSRGQQTPSGERPAWREKALENLRMIAPASALSPEVTSMMVLIAAGCDDPVFGLGIVEAGLRKTPNDRVLLGQKLDQELSLKLLDRAEVTAKAFVAAPDPKDGERLVHWDSVVNLAYAYVDADRQADGLRWCELVQSQLMKLDRAKFAGTWDGLGVCYWKLKRYDKAIPVYEQNLTLRRQTKGEKDRETVQTKINLGVNYRDAGRANDAIPMLEQADRDGRAIPSLRWARAELMAAYVAARKTAEGAALAKETLAEARKERAPESAALANELVSVGSDLVRLRASADAEPLLREGLAIREKVDADAWTTFSAKSLVGEALAGQKKYAEAEPLLLKGYEGMKQRAAKMPVPSRATRLAEAADALASLYDALDKKDEAVKWRAERDAVKKAGPSAPR
jgi:tetratricopeptide (TPR) repeat protein